MMVRFDVTIVTAGPTAGVLNGLPVGANQVVYVDLSKVNYANDTIVGGGITLDTIENITVGDVVGNVTFNSIKLTHQEITNL